jgi:hypothetical protein
MSMASATKTFPQTWVFSSVTAQLVNPTEPFRPLVIEAIPRSEGRRLALSLPDIVTADYWFSDPTRRVLGFITQDTEEPQLFPARKRFVAMRGE